MPPISQPEGTSGVPDRILAYPETETYLGGLAEVLLDGPSSLTSAERNVIATYVSSACECHTWHLSRAAGTAERLTTSFRRTPVSDKLKALLVIAAKVQQGGRHVTDEDVARAQEHGADARAIHDTVLIAGVFGIYNVCERIGAGLARGRQLHAPRPECGPSVEGPVW
jgi:hypothetical protein